MPRPCSLRLASSAVELKRLHRFWRHGARLIGPLAMPALLASCSVAPPNIAPVREPAPEVAPTADNVGQAMWQLAQRAGCTACHQVDPSSVPLDDADSALASSLPVAPFWRDVARQYRGDAQALARLTATVRAGSEPLAPHWAGVSGLAMPAQRQLISPAELHQLLAWILTLPDPTGAGS